MTATFTRRQLAVITELAHGHNTHHIATTLHLPTDAIRSRIHRAATRTGIHRSRHARLVHHAYLHGHLTPPPTHQPPTDLPPLLAHTLDAITRGLSVPETAAELGVTPGIARDYRRHLYRRLGACNQAHAIAIAWQQGIFTAVPPAPAPEPPAPPPDTSRFTAQQRRVVAGLARGHAEEQIARALFLSPHTVRAHIRGAAAVARLSSPYHQRLVEYGYQTGALARLAPEPRDVQPLPRRLVQVLDGVRRGLPDCQIAAELGVSVPTVRTHVRRLLRALGARTRAHAVALGWQAGLLGPGVVEGRDAA
ncbi:LuxR C-terminal-related transcriptional regulator [Streptomyces alboflavus]|uniref:LuxR C-terminal-related transcriptional regulator n=1 Tax=Streptomyces alboflavus TaxID=67267 RepID=UPI0006895F69|nr:LuxR C-terminal-related transcriptional regulator [Streptomyces alboflavus]